MARVLVLALLALVGVVIVALLAGVWRWSAGTRELRARITAASEPVQPETVDFRGLNGHPHRPPAISARRSPMASP
jgi:hypothetical protein